MTTPNDRSRGDNSSEVHHADPDHAAVDPRAAAKQDQVKADHDALEASARRVESSVSSDVSDTPIRHTPVRDDAPRTTGLNRTNREFAATDPQAAARQDQVKADHDALEASARRVKASVPSAVRDTPIQQPANLASSSETVSQSDLDETRENANAARDSMSRVEEDLDRDHNRR